MRAARLRSLSTTALLAGAACAMAASASFAGDLFVTSWNSNAVLRYDDGSGAFVDAFVPSGSGGLNLPHSAVFGPDGDLYVASFGNSRVKRYDGQSGAFIGNFVTPANGLVTPHGLDFRPDGMLYVVSFGGNRVQRYDAGTGAYVDDFVQPGNGLNGAIAPMFRNDDTLNLSAVDRTFEEFLAEPGEPILFLLDAGPGPGAGTVALPALPCAGTPIGLSRPLVLGRAVADAAGVAVITVVVPPALSGSTFRMQAIGFGTCRTSEVLLHMLP